MNAFFRAFISVLILSFPALASAATLSLSAQPATVGVGTVVRVTVSIDSVIPVNAFSGTLHFPPSLLAPIAVSDGDSIISMWITHPATTTGSVVFAGATPGGFSGRNGRLFSVLFRTIAAGNAPLSLADTHVLRNDGAGTNEPATLVPADISIAQGSRAAFTEPADTAPPEPFMQYLGRSPQLFDDQYYLAFAAVDKESGIDHYEAAETRWPRWLVAPVWEKADSPYVIHDQYLTSDVLIKAVDRAGNERLSVFRRRHLMRPDEWLALCGILLVWAVFWYRQRNTGPFSRP